MILVLSSPFFSDFRAHIAELAIQQRLPTMFIFKGYVLNGAKPADLPIEQATKFELAVNLKTANAIGVDLSTSILGARRRGDRMRRREFITLVGAGAMAWPTAARAQPTTRPRRIGLLMTMAETEPEAQARLASFRAGLQQLGWTEGRNIKIDYRFADGDPERLQSSAAGLVQLAPDVILANGTAILSALRRETKNIPIVFVLVPDPVGDGFIDSLARPGGNVTGLTNFEFTMGGKWVELLKEIAPRVSRVALVFNPETAPYAPKFLQFVARGAEAAFSPVRSEAEITRAAEEAASKSSCGLIVLPDLFTSGHRGVIVERYRLAAIYPFRFFARSGGLISYGVDTLDLFRRSGSFVDRITEGGKARRPSGRGADQVRNGDQPQGRKSARPRRTPAASAARRRGDRVGRSCCGA